MKNKWLFLIALTLFGVGIIWSVVLYFDNWDKVMSDHEKFNIYKFPILIVFVGYGFYIWAKIKEK